MHLDDKDGVEAALDEENLMDESDEDVPATQVGQRDFSYAYASHERT